MRRITTWIWNPQKDITTYELAVAMKAVLNAAIIETFPPEVKRHFVAGEQTEDQGERWKGFNTISFCKWLKRMR